MKNGVPWDVAWSMDDDWRLASLVTLGEIDGNYFDWTAMRWQEKDGG